MGKKGSHSNKFIEQLISNLGLLKRDIEKFLKPFIQQVCSKVKGMVCPKCDATHKPTESCPTKLEPTFQDAAHEAPTKQMRVPDVITTAKPAAPKPPAKKAASAKPDASVKKVSASQTASKPAAKKPATTKPAAKKTTATAAKPKAPVKKESK